LPSFRFVFVFGERRLQIADQHLYGGGFFLVRFVTQVTEINFLMFMT
jgi:hypothetical protein